MSEPARRRQVEPDDRQSMLRSALLGIAVVAVLLGVVLLIRPQAIPLIGAKDDPTPSPSAAPGTAGPTDALGLPTAAATAVTDPAERGANPTDPGDDGVLTATDLEPFALRGADLDVGWFSLDRADTALRTLIGDCLESAIDPRAPHVRLTTGFRRGSQGPVLSATVRDFTLVSRARSSFAAESKAIRACVSRGAGPNLTSASVSAGADDAIAVRFTVRRNGGEGRGVLIVARVDQRTVTVITLGATAEDLAVAANAARTVVDRLG